MLPAVIRDLGRDFRIMTYDWNANDHQSASGSKGFLDHADTLLLDLHLDRKATVRDPIHHSRSNVKLMLIQNRLNVPIIFIASCFGGLLLAKVFMRVAYFLRHLYSLAITDLLSFLVGQCDVVLTLRVR